MSPRWREWTPEQRMASKACAAYLFLNLVPCPECGLPWAQGYVHFDCPGPMPVGRPREGVIRRKTKHPGSFGVQGIPVRPR